jgi:hypothetical protein
VPSRQQPVAGLLDGSVPGWACWPRPLVAFRAGLLHVDMFAHNKSGIAHQDRNRRPETVVDHKTEPRQQPRLLPSRTVQHLVQASHYAIIPALCRGTSWAALVCRLLRRDVGVFLLTTHHQLSVVLHRTIICADLHVQRMCSSLPTRV